ncbi:tyrosine-type recombinase/integrase [Falsiroseomonas sp. CW058]|uniref:tyrosine-type recombinase/integrase n=1 Tax=Falsiroseomonas sp. CW058 TaxID=3388664 RepID=UPI003D312196
MPLSDTKLRAVRPTGARVELPDRGGLSLRVGASGAMTWTLTYRVKGKGDPGEGRVARLAGPKCRMALGSYPAMGLSEAREAALAARRLARDGIDPGAAQRAQAAAQAAAITVADLIERYAADHLRRNLRSAPVVEALLARHVRPAWGHRPVAEVTRGDLLKLLDDVRQPRPVEVRTRGRGTFTVDRGGAGAAAEVRKWVRAMFQYAVEAEMRPDNPFAGVRNRDRARPRDRVLSMEELRAVWTAACATPYPWGPFYQLLILTGCRRGEWATARWLWLDEAWSALEIPAEHYKTDRPHVVPLSPLARSIVAALPAPVTGDHLFSSDGGQTAIAGFSDAKAALERLAAAYYGGPMTPWVVHDLRRSMATHMERLGVAPHVIEACLGHVLKGVAGTYRRYNFLPEKLDALQRWADTVRETRTLTAAAA